MNNTFRIDCNGASINFGKIVQIIMRQKQQNL